MIVEAYCDGSGTTADEPACIGVVVLVDGEPSLEVSRFIGMGTNNYAELVALGTAMRVLGEMFGPDVQATIRSDSMYALWAATKQDLPSANGKLVWQIRKHRATMPHLYFEHVEGHFNSFGNKLADWLAGEARARYFLAQGTVKKRKRRPVAPVTPPVVEPPPGWRGGGYTFHWVGTETPSSVPIVSEHPGFLIGPVPFDPLPPSAPEEPPPEPPPTPVPPPRAAPADSPALIAFEGALTRAGFTFTRVE